MTQSKTKKSRRNGKSLNNPALDNHKERNFITLSELDLLVKACSRTRSPIRNKAIVQTMFWHGLRVSELCQLKVSDLDLKAGRLHVRRLKQSLSTTHPVRPEVLRTLRKYLKERDSQLRTLFLNERNDEFRRQGIGWLLRNLSEKAGLPFPVNPHMLRHGCGYALANMGHDTRLIQDYLGHKDIKHTVTYTRTASKRFEAIWD